MDGVAALLAQMPHGRLEHHAMAAIHAGDQRLGASHLVLKAGNDARPHIERGLVADQLAPLRHCRPGDSNWLSGTSQKFGVAVIGFAVGKGQFHRLDHDMDEFRPIGVHGRRYRSPPAMPAIAATPAPAPRRRSWQRSSRDSHSVTGFSIVADQLAMSWALSTPLCLMPLASMTSARAEIILDLLGDETAIEHRPAPPRSAARGPDLPSASLSSRVQVLANCRIAEIGMGRGRSAARQPGLVRRRPFLAEELAHFGDGLRRRAAASDGPARHSGSPAPAPSRRLQRAIVAQHQHPAVERAGHHRRQQPVAGNDIEPFGAIMLDGRARPAPAPARRSRRYGRSCWNRPEPACRRPDH